MMISNAMAAKLNDQVTMEFGASHKYLAMACVFDQMGLKILCRRFLQQTEEEHGHAMKIVKYLRDVAAPVQLAAVPQPKADYKSVGEIVQAALDSEWAVTRSINDIVTLAEQEKDYATRSFLEWFVDEQVEEVASMTDLLTLVKLAGPNVLQVEARVFHEMKEEK